MKRKTHIIRWLPLWAVLCLATADASTGGAAVGNLPAVPKGKVAVKASAYSFGAACNGAWAKRNAIGGSLKSGQVNSAAADWSKFPLGTKFRVVESGKIYVVDDYGSAMVGKDKVDLYMSDYSQVDRWGVRNVTLEIIEWGCPERSLAILKPRARPNYIRRMVNSLQSQLGQG